VISGDIFIGNEQVGINANEYQTSFEKEIIRVIIHGVLHLVGYTDENDEERSNMRRKEDIYLCKL